MDAKKQNKEYIDLREVAKKLRSRKRLFIKVWLITIVVSAVWIFPKPRYYTTEVLLAPESNNGGLSSGTLGSIASSFGINLSSEQGADAIYPMIYPDIFSTKDFAVSLLDIQVETLDGSVHTDYYTYLSKHTKVAFYSIPFIWLRKQLKSWFDDRPKSDAIEGGKINPHRLTDEQEGIVKGVQKNITCDVDLKTELISISVTDQDPLVCATIADSLSARLQHYITVYRTSKARVDLEYYEKLTEEARLNYEKSLNAYGAYCDANRDVILQTAISERDRLENDMQLKLNTYNTLNTQLEIAKAKVQERTPAFTVLQGASLPTKPAGPKRIIFIIGMLFLSTIGTILHIFKHQIKNQILTATPR